MGTLLAKRGIGLVYGGGNVGLMGTIARAVLDHGGHVCGVIPEFLKARELMIARFDLETTEPEWALGFQWDIILRSTPFEE